MANLMMYANDDFNRISLWDRTGVKLLMPAPGGILVDYSAIPAILESVFSELSAQILVDGQIGQRRGIDFENEVYEYLSNNIASFKPWICHRKLEFLSGIERDIDVSFLHGDVLFVLECKAFSVSTAFDRGEINALEIRKGKLNLALKQADTLCELLSKERKGKNFEIPQMVTHIISIVASPFPEYIPERNDRYFLTRNIPRVCTPQEIVEFVNEFKLFLFISKPFVWKIS